MTFRPAIAAALAAVTLMATPAFAMDHLAKSLGVTPGLYSQSQLARLATLNDDGNDQALRRAILAQPKGPLADVGVSRDTDAMPTLAAAPKTLNVTLSVKTAPASN